MRCSVTKMTIKNSAPAAPEVRPWSLFSRHGHVLISLAQNPELRMRDLAAQVGVTERSVRKMIVALEESGVLTTRRVGRKNIYEITRQHNLRHPFEAEIELARILDLVVPLEADAPE